VREGRFRALKRSGPDLGVLNFHQSPTPPGTATAHLRPSGEGSAKFEQQHFARVLSAQAEVNRCRRKAVVGAGPGDARGELENECSHLVSASSAAANRLIKRNPTNRSWDSIREDQHRV